MRVLFSGAFNPRFEALPEWIAAAFRDTGHEVVCFDHRAFRIPGRIRARIPSLDRLDRAALNRKLLTIARRFLPHLVLVNQGTVITEKTYRSIRREIGAITANWWSDYPAEFEDGLELARSGACDLFYVSGTDAESRHHHAGATETRWLPFGCDPHEHRPVNLTEADASRYRCRVAFVGSAYPERKDVLVQLLDLGLGVWGPGWDRYRDDPEFGRSIRGDALRPSEWRKVYSAADLVLNLSYGFGGPREVYGTMANVRVFEALACGACQVVDAKQDIARLFRDGEHLVLFRSPGEARRAVADLLADGERRRAIGEAGRREALAFHTWRHRTDRIVGDLMSLLRPKAAEGAR